MIKHSSLFHIGTCGTLAMFATSCMTWQREEPQLRPGRAVTMDSTRVTLRDGIRITLDSAKVTADSLVGWRSGADGDERSAYARDQVQRIERRALDYNSAGLVAVVVGGLVGAAVWMLHVMSDPNY